VIPTVPTGTRQGPGAGRVAPGAGRVAASAWQRLAPGADAVLADIDSYLDHPDTVTALAAADSAGAYPRAVLSGLQTRGLAELLDPAAATPPQLAALNAMTARRSGSLAITVGVNALALLPVYLDGSDEQCRLVAHRLRAGGTAALLLTELDHGSNLLRIDARAERYAAGYRLSGEKHLINGGTEHDLLVTLMRTRTADPDGGPGLRDLSLLLVERDASIRALARWRTVPAPAADISGVRFDGTRVPVDAVIGREGDGFALVQKTLKLSHGGIAALASGTTSAAVDLAVSYARERDVFGVPIVTHGAIAEHCVRMVALDVVVAALAVKASRLANRFGAGAGYFAAAAKFACCQLAEEAVGEGRRVLGARALLEELPYARLIRDVLLFGVFDGTSHVVLDEVSCQLPRFAGADRGAGPGRIVPVLADAYAAAPEPIRAVARRPWRSYAPALAGRCAAVGAAAGEPALDALGALAAGLSTVVRAARAARRWEADQALRFEAAAILAEVEALLAACELTLPRCRELFGLPPVARRDTDATEFALAWLGARLAARLASLSRELDCAGALPPVPDLADRAAPARQRLRDLVSGHPDLVAGHRTGWDRS
jgi:alkylation response protein AidB-like acyl-CoA dehydrogenase